MMFAPQARTRDRVFSAVGSRIVETFTGKLDEKGRVVLFKTGEKNIYNEIQSHKDSVDLQMLIVRSLNGEPDALTKRQGVFADMTGAPKTLAEMLNYVNAGRAEFDALPLETREKFGCDFSRYAASIGTPEWMAAISRPADSTIVDPVVPAIPQPTEPVKEVVSE